jgi:hypothetical protein
VGRVYEVKISSYKDTRFQAAYSIIITVIDAEEATIKIRAESSCRTRPSFLASVGATIPNDSGLFRQPWDEKLKIALRITSCNPTHVMRLYVGTTIMQTRSVINKCTNVFNNIYDTSYRGLNKFIIFSSMNERTPCP